MRKHKNISIRGVVQGVAFRYAVQKKAKELGIAGFVRNEPDGAVYIETEGPEEALDAFVEWCRQGPPHARVEQVSVEEGSLKNFQDFSILL